MLKEEQASNKNIYVLEVDMENKTVEEIAKDAAMQILELFDKLAKKQDEMI